MYIMADMDYDEWIRSNPVDQQVINNHADYVKNRVVGSVRTIICKDGVIEYPLDDPAGLFSDSAPMRIDAADHLLADVKNVVEGRVDSFEQWQAANAIGVNMDKVDIPDRVFVAIMRRSFYGVHDAITTEMLAKK